MYQLAGRGQTQLATNLKGGVARQQHQNRHDGIGEERKTGGLPSYLHANFRVGSVMSGARQLEHVTGGVQIV